VIADKGSACIRVFEEVLVVIKKLIVRKETVIDEYNLQTELRPITPASTRTTRQPRGPTARLTYILRNHGGPVAPRITCTAWGRPSADRTQR
jgi:hypothetical protein